MVAPLLAATLSANVELRIEAERTTIALGEDPAIRATIRNGSRRTLHLIDVLDGSAWHWTNPKVGWSAVLGNAKHPAATPKLTLPRCGNVNPLAPREFFNLEPRESHGLSVQWAPLLLEHRGTYRVKFYYWIDRHAPLGKADQPGTDKNLLDAYRSATPIELVSNELSITVR